MNRRIVLISGAAAAVGGSSVRQEVPTPTLAEIQRQFAEQRAKALATLPYERVEVADWADFEHLRTSGRGWPVIVGGDEDLGRVAEGYGGFDSRSPTEILSAAKGLQHRAIRWPSGPEREGRRRKLYGLSVCRRSAVTKPVQVVGM